MKQFFKNPITIIIVSLLILGVIYVLYNKHAWFGSAKLKYSPSARMGMCWCGKPKGFFGCSWTCREEIAKQKVENDRKEKLVDDCVNNSIAQDPKGNIEGFRQKCKTQIMGITYFQTPQATEETANSCWCDGKRRHWLFGCRRCR